MCKLPWDEDSCLSHTCLSELSQQFLSCLPVAMKRQHDQGDLERKHLVGSLFAVLEGMSP